MSETSTTHRPINLANVAWREGEHKAMFSSSRPGWGVEVIATGEVLQAMRSTQPAAWDTKAIAQIIANHPSDFATMATIKA
jgi:hypothetical protein